MTDLCESSVETAMVLNCAETGIGGVTSAVEDVTSLVRDVTFVVGRQCWKTESMTSPYFLLLTRRAFVTSDFNFFMINSRSNKGSAFL